MQQNISAPQTDLLRRSKEEIRAIQDQRFRHQIDLCFKAHPYYQEVFASLHLKPDDFQTLADIHKLPPITKQDYMKDPQAFRLHSLPEFSPYERILWDISYTTGTTSGVPTPFFNTTHDYYATLEQLRRFGDITGITEKDTIVNLFPLTPVPHIGFLRTRDLATMLGAPTVSTLTGTPYPAYPVHRRLDDVVRMIEQSHGTVVSGIVSYVRRVVMRAEELGADFSRVRLLFVLGEPCPRGMREDMRRRLVSMGANRQQLKIVNALGLTEMQGNTGECAEFSGGHNVAPDQFYMEVLDEHSHEPIADGQRGLFTLTHLDRRGTVLLRYITGDLNVINNEVCPHCGRQGPRVVSNTVRTIELLKVKGTLINPDVIKEAIATVDGIEEYQIVFTKEQPDDPYSQDKLLIRVAASADEQARIKTQLIVKVTEAAEMRSSIEFVGMSEIFDPAKTLKSTRVVDLRPTEAE